MATSHVAASVGIIISVLADLRNGSLNNFEKKLFRTGVKNKKLGSTLRPTLGVLNTGTIFSCTDRSIYLGRVEPTSPIELTAPRMEAPQARWSFVDLHFVISPPCVVKGMRP